jgi:hypothetical protein
MDDLAGVQQRMMQALNGPAAHGEGLFTDPDGRLRERLAIYRNTVQSNFVESLKAGFPVLLQLVGDEYFGQLARQYLAGSPSRSGDLLAVGERFGEHITHVHAADEYAYFADVARFEWLVQESRLARDGDAADFAHLSAVPAEAYGALRFALHPSLRLFQSAFPILEIWQAHVATKDLSSINLNSGQIHLAIHTLRFELGFSGLSAAEYRFVAALQAGITLEGALALAARPDDPISSPAMLTRLATLGLIERIY